MNHWYMHENFHSCIRQTVSETESSLNILKVDTMCHFLKQFCKYSRLHLIYPHIIETVKDWADCEQLTPIEVGQIFVKV